MNKFKIMIAPEAIEDIDQASIWHNEQLEGLVQRFSRIKLKHQSIL